MNVRRGLFRIWIAVTAVYVIWGIIDSAEGIYWKFHISAQGRWLHLAIAVAMAVGVPLLVLGIGWAFFWIADGFRQLSANEIRKRLPEPRIKSKDGSWLDS
jgi:hypothetical protein